MAMNGNININVFIKGNNNTTNLINKIEVKKNNGEYNTKKEKIEIIKLNNVYIHTIYLTKLGIEIRYPLPILIKFP